MHSDIYEPDVSFYFFFIIIIFIAYNIISVCIHQLWKQMNNINKITGYPILNIIKMVTNLVFTILKLTNVKLDFLTILQLLVLPCKAFRRFP